MVNTLSFHQRLHSHWDKLGQIAAISLGFVLPISTALTTIMMGMVVIAWLLGPKNGLKREILFNHPLVWWLYPLIFCTLMGATYSIGSNDAIRSSLADVLRLGFIPLLLYFYHSQKIARLTLWAFTCAMILTLLLAFLKMYAGLPIGMKYTAGAVFKSYIKTSYFMAVSAFFLATQVKVVSSRYRAVLILLIAMMIYYLLFMNVGRIGYICLVTFLLLFAWQKFHLKGILAAALVAMVMVGGAYLTSPTFAQRLNVLSQDLDFYHAGRLVESSLGSRLQFAHSSLGLMAQHPLLGWGTGSYGAAYAQYHDGEDMLLTDNPHNEFLRTGVELGALGLGLLLLLFYQQWRLSVRLPTGIRHFWQGILMTFVIGCFLNSWLKDSTEGHFFCLMSAICFSYLPLREKQWVAQGLLNKG